MIFCSMEMAKRFLLKLVAAGLALLGTATSLAYASDDWFDVEQGFYLGASIAGFDDGARGAGVQFQAPLPLELEMLSQYTYFDFDNDSGDAYLLHIQSDRSQILSVGLGIESQASDFGYKLQGLSGNAILTFGSWETQLRLGRSDLEFAVDVENTIVEERIQELGLLDASRDRVGFSIGYFSQDWGLRFNLDDYDLDRDRSLNEIDQALFFQGLTQQQRSELFSALSSLSNDRPFLELYRSLWITNYAISEQVNISADYSVGFDLYFWDQHAHAYSLGLMHVEQLGSNSGYLQGVASADFNLGGGATLGLLLSAEDAEASAFAELSVGYRW